MAGFFRAGDRPAAKANTILAGVVLGAAVAVFAGCAVGLFVGLAIAGIGVAMSIGEAGEAIEITLFHRCYYAYSVQALAAFGA